MEIRLRHLPIVGVAASVSVGSESCVSVADTARARYASPKLVVGEFVTLLARRNRVKHSRRLIVNGCYRLI